MPSGFTDSFSQSIHVWLLSLDATAATSIARPAGRFKRRARARAHKPSRARETNEETKKRRNAGNYLKPSTKLSPIKKGSGRIPRQENRKSERRSARFGIARYRSNTRCGPRATSSMPHARFPLSSLNNPFLPATRRTTPPIVRTLCLLIRHSRVRVTGMSFLVDATRRNGKRRDEKRETERRETKDERRERRDER